MTPKVLVTGATGLIGSNVCEQALLTGYQVRALVRPGNAATDALKELGVECVDGDVTRNDSVSAAVRGCDFCVHTAALVIGEATYSSRDYMETNLVGTRNILRAASRFSVRRTIAFGTPATFSWSQTLTESSPTIEQPGDPHAASKLRALEECQRHIRAGEDVLVAVPGATFGPAPSGLRAATPPGFNARIVGAIRGELTEMPKMTWSFVLAADVAAAAIGALERGQPGATYLLFGRMGDEMTAVDFLNAALEVAGSERRIRNLTREKLTSPSAHRLVSTAMVKMAEEHPNPLFNNSATVEALNYQPKPLSIAIPIAVEWLKKLALG